MSSEFSNICTNPRHDIHEHEGDNQEEQNIEDRDHDIGRSISSRELVAGIFFPFCSPIMKLTGYLLSRLEKYIRTDKNDEEKYQEII